MTIEKYETTRETIDAIAKLEPQPYIVKVKCLACEEGQYVPYKKMYIEGKYLIIGERRYPEEPIETITIKTHHPIIRRDTIAYRITPTTLKRQLADNASQKLSEMGLL